MAQSVLNRIAFMCDHDTGRRKARRDYGTWKPNLAKLERAAKRTASKLPHDSTLQDIVDKRNAKLGD